MKALLPALLVVCLALVSIRADSAEESMSIEQYLQKLSTVPDVIGRKDPFIAAPPPFDIPQSLGEDGVNMSAPVLERYPVTEYSVVATLLGDQYPRALLRLPASEKGKVLIVKVKDKIGSKGGVISKIRKDGVVVVQSRRSPLGFADKSEIVLPVGVAAGGAPPAPGQPVARP